MTDQNPYASPSLLASTPTQETPSPADIIAKAKRDLGRPGTAIIVMASIHSVFDSIPLVELCMMKMQGVRLYATQSPVILSSLLLCVHILQAIGGAKMAHLESKTLAYIGVILVLIPFLSPFFFLGIPFGIWAIVLLRKPQNRLAFELARRPS